MSACSHHRRHIGPVAEPPDPARRDSRIQQGTEVEATV